MKTIEQIINSEPIILNDWEDEASIFADFEEKQEGEHILFASYAHHCYEGVAWVLFEKNRHIYEVNGYHCSCFGLEGQWCPDEVSLKELEHRVQNGTFGEDDFKTELKLFLCIE